MAPLIRQTMILSRLIVTEKDHQSMPELFHHTDIEPSQRVRTRPMRVLAIGFARTGTMSLRAALSELGIGPTYHMMSWYTNPKDGKFWRHAIDAKFNETPQDMLQFTRDVWDQVLGDCQAAIDAPTAAFMPELIRAYPEAKVIVSERNADKWVASYRQTIKRTGGDWWLANVIAPLDRYFLRDHAVLVRQLFQSVLHGKYESITSCKEERLFEEDEEAAIKRRYRALHDEVRKMVPADNLLEWNLEEGWKPLCSFLRVKCPDTPFPHINDTATFQRRQYVRKWLAVDRILIDNMRLLLAFVFAILLIWILLM